MKSMTTLVLLALILAAGAACNIDNPFSADTGTEPRLAPIASFTWDNAGLFVQFRNTSRCDGDPCDRTDRKITYEWIFGDLSGTSNEFEPLHEYQVEGTYRVVLRVNDREKTDETEQLITVP